MAFQFKRRLSLLVGWAADRRIPGPLRSPVYRTYASLTGAELGDGAGRVREHLTELSPTFAHWIAAHAYGTVLARPGLTPYPS